jgi:hypothetical protein
MYITWAGSEGRPAARCRARGASSLGRCGRCCRNASWRSAPQYVLHIVILSMQIWLPCMQNVIMHHKLAIWCAHGHALESPAGTVLHAVRLM